jgi:hypothetical protein
VSTFLVSLGAVAAATVLVIWIALGDPDQPATIRRDTDRARARRSRREPTHDATAPAERGDRPAAQAAPAPPAVAPDRGVPDRGVPDRGVPVPRARRRGALRRLRSALALMVLVAFTGVLVALVIGAGLAVAARALRHAVG